MGPQKYRKKPVVIEALEWDGTEACMEGALEFIDVSSIPDPVYVGGAGLGYTPALGTLDIPTLEGIMTASPGDFIIKGVAGECYPCKPEIFESTYERVDE